MAGWWMAAPYLNNTKPSPVWEAFCTGQGKKWAYLLVRVNYRSLLHFNWQLTLYAVPFMIRVSPWEVIFTTAQQMSLVLRMSTTATVNDALHSKSKDCPIKNQRWKPSAAHLARGDGGELIAGCCLLLLLLFGLWGFSQSPGFFSISDSYLLWLSFLSPPCIWLLVAPKGLIYACGAAET